MTNEANKDILEETPAITEQDVTPRDLMQFAKSILTVLAILFVLGAICDLIQPKSEIFEACRTILPSIATLVIGYYFGKSG